MGFEQNALTIASHLTMIAVLIVLVVRLVLAGANSIAWEALGHGLTPALAIACVGLMLERTYYVLARIVKPHGVDLWNLHPAPEVLSFIVGAGLFVVSIPLVFVKSPTPRQGWTRISVEAFLFLCLWALLVWVFY
ncbi:hypothetical protein [Roseobacter sp. OBYS 0001]|uniref:hypothetical protein n=1 Tax=Roseobacter sp. OBYS 0001 TaxID=882651 RepID=UPI001BC09792|nr:hypothetical protein [Roseobacter sp. OBYS 0001]GIT85424.1 hypothetical protein ROBYS_04400 [Roseobacter sp. OBYS 0001]